MKREKKGKVKPARAWGVLIQGSGHTDGKFDTLCYWAAPSKREVLEWNCRGERGRDTSCYRPVRVEIRLIPRKSGRRDK